MIAKTLFPLSALLMLMITSCDLQKKPPCDCEKLRFPAFRNEVQGAGAVQLKGLNAGYPLDSMPGIKSISTADLLKLKEEPKTGLFLVDTDFVPQELAKDLKEKGYSLQKDGTLDSAGVKKTLFIQAAVYQIKQNPNAGGDQPDSLQNKKPAQYAFPQPWAAYGYSFWWHYDGGFCRGYDSHTRAYAYGARVGTFWPFTNVEWIQTHASAWDNRDNDVCRNCHELGSDANVHIGCFWPAHGGGSGNHYIYIYDSGASAFVNWGW